MFHIKILLATDGSDNSIRASDYIIKLSGYGLKLEVTVLSVIPLTKDMSIYLGVNEDEYNRLSDIRVRSIFEPFEEAFNKYENIKASFITVNGEIPEAIVSFANEGQYDQIIIGSRGLSNVKEFFLGSVSHKVVRLAQCPVVIVK
ncbi:universal stress protein [Desulforamulus aquiferis]|uniref:Universal stress protein n=1 Tax=Desulforamulus aquiferis TaxID=1397668 RepID=A0AAW7ZEH9_9FIRM|nr:universal stress protein [Desulforamulus aquiferis]MDO7787689.1 universal stress protein [Desulforamulus aquiferis]RYD05928.1 hypothetical protein N752_06700 [Desulforamulus aquiferis]